MIRVLRSWDEVGAATLALARNNLPGDPGCVKNWDLWAIRDLVLPRGKTPRVLDMGAGGSLVVRFLAALGLKDLQGVDLHVSLTDRLRQWKRMLKQRTWKPPWRLYSMDLTRTRFADHSFDIITCVSVMEHGVAWGPFLKEARRLLRPRGVLYVSVDYWEPKIAPGGFQPYGLPWNIFSAEEIQEALILAAQNDFSLMGDSSVPLPQDAVVYWGGQSYTFLSMSFRAGEGGRGMPAVGMGDS